MPLALIELKAIAKPAKDAYDDNLRDYKTTIPQLFWHNAVVILSNGTESRIGTITSEGGPFAEQRGRTGSERSSEGRAPVCAGRKRFKDRIATVVIQSFLLEFSKTNDESRVEAIHASGGTTGDSSTGSRFVELR